jgi:alpha-L-rhamnosidase
MMAEMAAALGEAEQAARWTALVPKIRDDFVAAYRSPDGSIHTGTQTVYGIALGMDLIADPQQRKQTAEKFVAKLAADNDHLKTGFLGTPWLLPARSRIGRDDLAHLTACSPSESGMGARGQCPRRIRARGEVVDIRKWSTHIARRLGSL